MSKKVQLVVIDSKERTLHRFEGKQRTHKAKIESGIFAKDAETIEIFRKNPDFILDEDDPETDPPEPKYA